MRTYTIWYNNGSGWYEWGGQYRAASEAEAIRIARADGMGWADIIVSDTDPNRP